MKPFYWTTRLLFRLFFFLFYRHKVYGTENLPKGAAIIAPNHVSFFDPPAMAASSPEELNFLARRSLFKNRFSCWVLEHLNTYPITRSGRDLESLRTLCHLLDEGKKVVIFPEGARSRDGNLGTIQQGVAMLALRCRCPIVPVHLEGLYEVWPRHKRRPKLWGQSSCHFGKPIFPEDFEALDKKKGQQALAQELERALHTLAIAESTKK